MIKNIAACMFALMATVLFAHDVQVYSVDNSQGKITPQTIEAAFVKNGFYISDNRDMNTPFIKQFQQTDFEIYNLFTLHHVGIVQKRSH